MFQFFQNVIKKISFKQNSQIKCLFYQSNQYVIEKSKFNRKNIFVLLAIFQFRLKPIFLI